MLGMFKRLILLTSLLTAPLIGADCACDSPRTLSELVDIALENNPATCQTWWNARRAAANLGVARSAYWPRIDFAAKAVKGQDYSFLNGPETTYTKLEAEAVVALMLYDYGNRTANYNATAAALLAANWQTDRVMQKVIMRVLEYGYATLYSQEVVYATETSVSEAEKLVDIAQKLNEAGVNSISDTYSSQTSLSQLKIDLANNRAQLDIHRAKLATSLGYSAECLFEVAPADTLIQPQTEDLCALIDLAMHCRADLMAKQAKLNESNWKLAKARSEYGPKIALKTVGGYETQFKSGKDDEGIAKYKVGVYLDYPLFDGLKTMCQNCAALADTQITACELAELQLDVALDVFTQSRLLKAIQEILPEAELGLTNAQKAYEGVTEKYRAGKERIAEVSIAHRQLVTARLRLSDIKTRLFVATANLAFATGTLAPPRIAYETSHCTRH